MHRGDPAAGGFGTTRDIAVRVDLQRSEDAVEACTGTDIEHRLTGLHLGERRR
jgi:hypothetical protein